MSKIIILALIPLMLVFSSGRKIDGGKPEIISFKNFPKEYSMGEPIEKIDLVASRSSRIYTIDSLFLLWYFEGNVGVGTLYNEKFEYVGSLGHDGYGSADFKSLYFSGQYEKDSEGNIKLWVHDQKHFKAYKIDLFKAIQSKNESFIERTILLPQEMMTISEVLINEKENIIFGRSDMISKGRYFYFNLGSKVVKWVDKLPDVTQFTINQNLKLAYHADSRLMESQNVFVSAMTFFDRIDYISTNGQILKSIIRDHGNELPDFSSENRPFNPNNRYYCMNLQINSDFIFRSQNGLSQNDLDKMKENYIPIKNSVHVFSLEGDPVVDLKFDYQISQFAVSQNNKFLFALDFRGEKISILKYKLPALLSGVE